MESILNLLQDIDIQVDLCTALKHQEIPLECFRSFRHSSNPSCSAMNNNNQRIVRLSSRNPDIRGCFSNYSLSSEIQIGCRMLNQQQVYAVFVVARPSLHAQSMRLHVRSHQAIIGELPLYLEKDHISSLPTVPPLSLLSEGSTRVRWTYSYDHHSTPHSHTLQGAPP